MRSILFILFLFPLIFLTACLSEDDYTFNNDTPPPPKGYTYWGTSDLHDQKVFKLSQALYTKGCEGLNEAYAFGLESFFRSYPILTSRLLHEGVCAEPSPDAGLETFELLTAKNLGTPETYYFIGEAYIYGKGRDKDIEKGKAYLRTAVQLAAPSYLKAKHEFEKKSEIGLYKNHWGLTQLETIRSLSNEFNKPHEVIAEVDPYFVELDELYAEKDINSAILNAYILRKLAHENIVPLSSAFEWLDYADYFLRSDTAKIMRLYWTVDSSIYDPCLPKIDAFCQSWHEMQNPLTLLLEAAFLNIPEATEALACLVQEHTSEETKPQALELLKTFQELAPKIASFNTIHGLPARPDYNMSIRGKIGISFNDSFEEKPSDSYNTIMAFMFAATRFHRIFMSPQKEIETCLPKDHYDYRRFLEHGDLSIR